MVKIVYLVRRKRGMGVEEFRNYWWAVHGPIAAKMPGLRRYIQSHTNLSGYRKGEPVWDGIAEILFDDEKAVSRAVESPEGRATAADTAKFLDLSISDSILTVEHILKDGPTDTPHVKFISFIRRKASMDPQAFRSYWRDQHGPLATKLPGLRRYVQSHVPLSAYQDGAEPRYDGVAEMWFDSTDAIRAAGESVIGQSVFADQRNLIDDSGTRTNDGLMINDKIRITDAG
jgi:uncharacterized protein (TIGR02118 family)